MTLLVEPQDRETFEETFDAEKIEYTSKNEIDEEINDSFNAIKNHRQSRGMFQFNVYHTADEIYEWLQVTKETRISLH